VTRLNLQDSSICLYGGFQAPGSNTDRGKIEGRTCVTFEPLHGIQKDSIRFVHSLSALKQIGDMHIIARMVGVGQALLEYVDASFSRYWPSGNGESAVQPVL